jgi:hypothetical protein
MTAGYSFVVCDAARCTFGSVPDLDTVRRVLVAAFDSESCARACDCDGNTVGESRRPCALVGRTGCPLWGGGVSALS